MDFPEWGERASGEEARRDKRSGSSFAGFDGPRGLWWRPQSAFGRALLALSAMLVVGGSVAAVLVLRSSLERDDRFRIAHSSNIQTEGLSEVTLAELLPVFGADIGKNIFFVHLEDRRREIEAIPWVKHATVMRVLPDRIRVDIKERTPVAFTQISTGGWGTGGGGETGLVDADGVLLTMAAAAMSDHHYSFPEVTGLSATAKPEERRERMAMYMRMMAELDANGQHNSQQISEVDLTDPEDARVRTADQGGDVVAHLGEEHFLERYQRYTRHIGEWRQQYPRLVGVDLRYDKQVVLKLGQGTTSATSNDAPAVGTSNQQANQPANPQQNGPRNAQPGQQKVVAQQPTATASAAHPQAGKTVAGKTSEAKADAAHSSASRTDKARAASKLKADKARAERARTEKNRKREAAHHGATAIAQRRLPPPTRSAQPAVEGQ